MCVCGGGGCGAWERGARGDQEWCQQHLSVVPEMLMQVACKAGVFWGEIHELFSG